MMRRSELKQRKRAIRDKPLTEDERAHVESHLWLVRLVLVEKRVLQVDWDDAFQIGVIGLIDATNTFDTSKGVEFPTYGAQCIRGRLSNFRRSKNAHKAKQESHEDEIASITAHPTRSEEVWAIRQDIRNAMDRIDPRCCRMLELNVVDGLSWRDIGAEHGFSHETARLLAKRGASEARRILAIYEKD
jgi:RNA polymerase sigma factor (sigma-70 family)